MPITKKWLSSLLLSAVCAAALVPAAALADPSISGVYPDHASMQSFITIYGSNFGNAQGTGFVTIGGRWVPVQIWSADAIHVVVNPLAYDSRSVALDTTYPVQVFTAAGSSKSNTVDFTLTSASPPLFVPQASPGGSPDQPVFECFNKSSFCPGDLVTIYGSGFGSAQGAGFVTIDVPFAAGPGMVITKEFGLPVLAWSENAISAVLNLPSGVLPGTWTVTVHRGNGNTTSGSFTGGILSNGNCIVGVPDVRLSRSYISFADLKIGTTAGPLCFTITNIGTGPLIINSIGIINCSDSVDPVYVDCSAVAGFAIVSGGNPGTLAPGQSRDVCITFSPKKAATFDATVSISTNALDSPELVFLHGTGDN